MTYFRIRPLFAIAALVAVILTVALGQWQLRRAAQKEAYQARVDAALAAPPFAPDSYDWPALEHELPLRRVSARGYWMPQLAVFLDNRQHAAKPGFYVLMPLVLTDVANAGADGDRYSDRYREHNLAIDGNRGDAKPSMENVLIVNRGWLPRDPADRTRIAPFDTPVGLVKIEGLLLADEPKLLELGTAPPGRLGGIWQNFDFERFSAVMERSVNSRPLRLILRQTSESPDGLLRDWQRENAMQSQIDRHHGYAFQWFSLAALIVALTLFHGIRNARPKE